MAPAASHPRLDPPQPLTTPLSCLCVLPMSLQVLDWPLCRVGVASAPPALGNAGLDSVPLTGLGEAGTSAPAERKGPTQPGRSREGMTMRAGSY
jgi:hypothetical protein